MENTITKVKSLSPEQIIKIAKDRGFSFEKITFEVEGNYSIKDSMFNHRDISHYNHLHKKMATKMKHEVIYQGDVTTFIRYYSFLGFSIPMVATLMDSGPNRIIEVFANILFQFVKVNTEKSISENKCLSILDFYIGCKSKILLFLFKPLFKKIVKDSFADYINEDVPYNELRGKLRSDGYLLTKDNGKFTHYDTLNMVKQNVFLTNNVKIPKVKTKIPLDKLENNKFLKFNNVDAFGFQIIKNENIIKIFPRLCPHEGGCLDVDNSYGGGYKTEEFLEKQQVKCTVHDRVFSPLATIDLNNTNKSYDTNLYKIKIHNGMLVFSIKNNIYDYSKIDWT